MKIKRNQKGQFIKGFRHTEGWKQNQRNKMIGKKYAIGYKHTIEAKEKIREHSKNNKYGLGHKHTEEWKRWLSERNKKLGIKPPSQKGKHFSKETKLKLKLLKPQNKENNNNWKGGITPIIRMLRNSDKYQEWRQQCFIRDNFTCQKCGARSGNGETVYLEAHHKTPFSKLIEEVKKYLPLLPLYEGAMTYTPLWNLDNGITLCKECHNKTKKGKPKI